MLQSSFENVLKCEKCTEDCYDQLLNDCIEFLEKNNYPDRICAEPDSLVREQQKKKLRNLSKIYSIKYCFHGTKHLYSENKKILMAHEAYKFVSHIHSEEHFSPSQMIEIAKKYPVFVERLISFIHEFMMFCRFCYHRSFGLKRRSLSNPYWKILEEKFDVTIENHSKIDVTEGVLGKYEGNLCEEDCLEDFYDRQLQICLYILKHGKCPPLPEGEGGFRKRQVLINSSKKMKIKVCNMGKEHLWLKDLNRRIPMANEAKYLAELLHGEKHLGKKGIMMILINKQNKLYPYYMEKAIDDVLDTCFKCSMNIMPQKVDVQSRIPIGKGNGKKLTNRIFNKVCELGKKEKEDLKKTIDWGERFTSDPEIVLQKINSVSIWEDVMSIKDEIAKDFHISSIAAEVAIDDLHWSRVEEAYLKEKLAEKSQIIYETYDENETMKVTVISTCTMRENYWKYGDCLSIDYVSKIIRKRDSSGRHFQVGFFTGQNNEAHTVIFAIVLLSSQMFIYHQKALEIFFKKMGDRIPQCIITPDSRQLFKALQNLKKKYNYKYKFYINWYYIIEFLRKQTNNEFQQFKVVKMYCEALKQPTQGGYQAWMLELRCQIVGTSVYVQFDKVGQLFCLSKITPIFVGFGLSSNRIHELYSFLESNLQYHIRLGMFFSNMFQIEKHLQQKEKKHPTPFYNESPISYLSHFTHEKIYQILQKAYDASQQFLKVQENGLKVRILDAEKCWFTLEYNLERRYWKCNCRQIYFTGIPCSHLIYIVMKNGGKVEYYINERWMCEVDQVKYEQHEEEMESEMKEQFFGKSLKMNENEMI